VEFLTTIRKIRDAQGLCDVGFRRAALGEKGSLAGTHVYALDCKAKKGTCEAVDSWLFCPWP
jgi:hypothetical protein